MPKALKDDPTAIIQNSWKSLTDKSRLNDAMIDYEQEEEDNIKLVELLKELTFKMKLNLKKKIKI